MLEFTNAPPPNPRGRSLPLRRCPQGKSLQAVVTSNDLIGCKTHFYGGKTVPCEGEECAACRDGVAWRWHAYLAAYDHASAIHFIFESTARAVEPFIAYRDLHGTIRGCLFKAERPRGRANSQVYISTKQADLAKYPIPDQPDVVKIMAMIWDLPDDCLEKARRMKEVETIATIDEKLNDVRSRIGLPFEKSTAGNSRPA